MSRVRYEITATLHVLSPLHLGSGGARSITNLRGAGDNTPPPDVAAIARDGKGTPYLPAPSIKGVLRREAESLFGHKDNGVKSLFGTIRRDSGATAEDGRKGLVDFRGASASHLPPVREAPYADRATGGDIAQGALGPGVFVLARTAIDHATGTAADHRLFFREAVAPGVQFPLRADIDLRGREADPDRQQQPLNDFLAVLARLAAEEGVSFGASQADGDGRLRLDPASLVVRRRHLAKDGTFAAETFPCTLPPPRAKRQPARVESFRLHCPGPFLVVDSSRLRKSGEETDKATPHLAPQTLNGSQPYIGGASIAGALRSRAAWLQQLDRRVPDNDRADGVEPQQLSPVQRLFGVTGFRGLVTLRVTAVEGARLWNVMSVKLDRFSGAPMDNQLFKTRAYIGTWLSFQLELGARGEKTAPSTEDTELFEALCGDVRTNGLELGHGTSKGFGWFLPEGTR